MSARVLFRAQSGAQVGCGHVMRTRAVAEEVLRLGATALVVVDDEASAEGLRAAGFEACTLARRPGWALERAAGAWIDGFRSDWSADLRHLARRGTPSYLVENRSVARESARFVVQPKLYVDPDPWERVHAERVLRGAAWIPLGAALRNQAPAAVRDLELLVTFGGSDPLGSTERVLAALPRGLRVAVSVGAFMTQRRGAIERAAAHLAAEILPPHAPLGPVMARARAAVTALGTTLYELAWLRTPALVLANYAEDRPVLEFYRAQGPFLPLGLARELDDAALAATLAQALARVHAPSAPLADLGPGAERLAERLLGTVPARLAA